MLKVGLTGGIAVGKSTIGAMMAEFGAHLIQSDKIAHDLMQPGKPVYEEVVRHFGASILNPDKTINRPRLAEVAFGDAASGVASRAAELNAIVHPEVIQTEDDWMAALGGEQPDAIAIVEAALILESHASARFDRLIVVTCTPEQRIERWAKRLSVDHETARREVTRRMAAQLPDSEKIKAAHYVIDNSGSLEDARTQVEEVFAKLKKSV